MRETSKQEAFYFLTGKYDTKVFLAWEVRGEGSEAQKRAPCITSPFSGAENAWRKDSLSKKWFWAKSEEWNHVLGFPLL